ncbi:hypothetical protein D3C83_124910 [compost metagenome]
MNVVVDVAGHQQQLALQVLGQVLVLVDVVFEGDFAILLDFLHAIVLFAPRPVVNAVVVVA